MPAFNNFLLPFFLKRPLRPHEAEKIKKVSAKNYKIPEDIKKVRFMKWMRFSLK